MYTEMYHVVHLMADVHTKNAQHVQCVPQCLALILLKNTHMEGSGVNYKHQYQNFMKSSTQQQ